MMKSNTPSATLDVPDTIPTILLPVTDNNGKLETYLQTGWRIVGKLSMTDPETLTQVVNDYVVLQPVHKMPAAKTTRWH